MELIELQNIWQQYDKKISENMSLNKEILRRMLQSKPEKMITRIKLKAGFTLILPMVMIPFIMVRNVVFRDEISFYMGIVLFGSFALITYYWAIRYYLLINKVNFNNPVTLLKKDIKHVEKYKIKITKFGYLFAPFGMTGVFLMANIPILSKHSILPITLILLVFLSSIYITFKYSIIERFAKINKEIEEIEKLESE
ncbi:MAG: hypothetical protein PHS48_03755 [Bacteroidales bacterium]|nr:hypothetical protein [Bacteroidales bacterium]